MEATVLHLHTYFHFPFSIDQDAVMEDHPKIWKRRQHWFANLDEWVTKHVAPDCSGIFSEMGGWRRASHTQFDAGSEAYQDMVFFHPFVRRIFFDTGDHNRDHEALLRSYSMTPPGGAKLLYEAEDIAGNSAKVAITHLRLLLFANGIGVLVLGVEAASISSEQALWINEMMRKIYPSSDRQIASGRIPNRLSLVLAQDSKQQTLAQETFDDSRLIGFRPRLSKLLRGLLYFADYETEEFEPVLDERMVVDTFISLNRDELPHDFERSEEYEIALSRFLYVERGGEGFRYDRDFLRKEMNKAVYRRWQQEGTLYGATSYSNVSMVLISPTAANTNAGALVHRMFTSKNHLIAIIALFYRATLLDFLKESALVSRVLFPIFTGETVRHYHLGLASRLMSDYNYFNNYWFFSEITTKDEELEHFQLLCDAYRITQMKSEVGRQIEKLAGYVDRLYALRNNDAVNRLAMLSMILGLGALVTGFYGMNIPHLTTALTNGTFSVTSLIATTIMTVVSICLIVYIVMSNWVDYRASLFPTYFRRSLPSTSLRRVGSLEDPAAMPQPGEKPAEI